ncbi:hypothetical protein [Ruegeria arenilitoris]|uniref:hypothetical protein n=1 Tax=Ruegeria arenilitoris TaxID=1173585 RepID=UPI0014814E96|nr:hypothetical protein [Ruegeria arenilitoris]
MKQSAISPMQAVAWTQAATLPQRACSCDTAKGFEDQCPVCAAKTRLKVKPKLTENQPSDRFEQEADRFASWVPPGPVRMSRATLQRMTKEGELQMKTLSTHLTNSAVTQAAAAVSRGGQPLTRAARGFFEPSSAKSIFSNRLPGHTVDWKKVADGAYKVMAKDGILQLNVWIQDVSKFDGTVKAFSDAGFKNARPFGPKTGPAPNTGPGVVILGTKLWFSS